MVERALSAPRTYLNCHDEHTTSRSCSEVFRCSAGQWEHNGPVVPIVRGFRHGWVVVLVSLDDGDVPRCRMKNRSLAVTLYTAFVRQNGDVRAKPVFVADTIARTCGCSFGARKRFFRTVKNRSLTVWLHLASPPVNVT